jgi:hypothetical protein
MRHLAAASLLVTLASIFPGDARAQAPFPLAYKRTPGDTLQYRMSSSTLNESTGAALAFEARRIITSLTPPVALN